MAPLLIARARAAGDLKRLIKKTAEQGKTLDEAAIWNFFMQIVDGLRYMHAHRIMHRDIKPANVLVGANGALKLGDLGLGRQLSEQTMEAFSKVGRGRGPRRGPVAASSASARHTVPHACLACI